MSYKVLFLVLGVVITFEVDAKRKEYQEEYEEESRGDNSYTYSKSFSSKVVLDNAYTKGDISGYVIPDKERSKIKRKMLNPEEIIYGEITYEATKNLLEYLKLTNRDVVYDLGSGVGKFCYQIALDTPVKKVVGIELCPTRFSNARKAMSMMEDDVRVSIEKRVFFKEEDFLKSDITDATVIFLCSTPYSDELMKKLTKKLGGLPVGLRVVTLKELAPVTLVDRSFVLVSTLAHTKMSWSNDMDVYVYELQSTKQAKPVVFEHAEEPKELSISGDLEKEHLLFEKFFEESNAELDSAESFFKSGFDKPMKLDREKTKAEEKAREREEKKEAKQLAREKRQEEKEDRKQKEELKKAKKHAKEDSIDAVFGELK